MINEILYQPVSGLVTMFVYNSSRSTWVMWRSVIDQPQDLICTKLILTSLTVFLTQLNGMRLWGILINSAWTYFSSKFNSFLKRIHSISVQKRQKNLYITREAKSLKNKRNRLWKRYIKSQSHSDHLAYTQACNTLRTLTRNLRNQFEILIANNIKASWNYARNRMKTHPAIGALKVLMASFAPQIRTNPLYLINSSPVFLQLKTQIQCPAFM